MLNKVMLIGNLGRDPEQRYTQDGQPIATIALASASKYKNKAGEMVEETEWHRVLMFGRLAEIAGQYLKKGSLIYVEGRLKTRKYKDNDGVEKYTTDIIASEMKMLGGRDQSAGPAPATKPQQTKPAAARQVPKTAASFADMDNDIPF